VQQASAEQRVISAAKCDRQRPFSFVSSAMTISALRPNRISTASRPLSRNLISGSAAWPE
jgi:hypothetical protein